MSKYNIFIFLLILCSIIYKTNGEKPYKIENFQVPLDHFSYAKNTTFNIRYLINTTFSDYKYDPIFFYTGNEGDIELFAENTGFMWEIAPKFKAQLVFAEHRYYGKSLPFGNKSYDSAEQLGYLSSQQALADFADLLRFLNPTNSRPVICFGGSYGGMLSAWFRMKYPHLVTGAIAASAPILQFQDLTACDIFNRILTSIFHSAYNKECDSNIKRSWGIIKDLATNADGRTKLNNVFKFCKNMTQPGDYQQFFEYLTDVYGNLAMVNYPYESSFLAPLPAYPVREFCGRLNEKFNDTQLLIQLQSAVSIYTNFTGNTKCLDTSSAYDSSMGDLGWEFQTCTEMVMPMCSTGETDMFYEEKWNLEKFSDNCFKKFGVRPRDEAATTYYGNEKLAGASNIVFSNGLLDPWSGGGVLRSNNDNVRITIIPDAAHHLDLRSSNAADPKSVIEARKMHISAIKYWIEH